MEIELKIPIRIVYFMIEMFRFTFESIVIMFFLLFALGILRSNFGSTIGNETFMVSTLEMQFCVLVGLVMAFLRIELYFTKYPLKVLINDNKIVFCSLLRRRVSLIENCEIKKTPRFWGRYFEHTITAVIDNHTKKI